MGRPAKPVERKRAAGNPGKRPLPEPAQVVTPPDSPPEPPAGLQTAGKAIWRAIWQEASSWLAPSDTPTVVLLAQTADEREANLRVLKREGRYYETKTGMRRPHPALAQVERTERQIITLLSLLGLTPSDRARLGVAEVRAMTGLTQFLKERSQDLA